MYGTSLLKDSWLFMWGGCCTCSSTEIQRLEIAALAFIALWPIVHRKVGDCHASSGSCAGPDFASRAASSLSILLFISWC